MILFHVILPGIHFRNKVFAGNWEDMRQTAVKTCGRNKKETFENVHHSVAVTVPSTTCVLSDI
jgi:hypothetical protein